jgi:hypothetical protein
MSTPPNVYITQAVWDLWLAIDKAIPLETKLGGIYANKSGYHNTRKANKAKWPTNYSIKLDLDKQGPDDKAAALDITFPAESDMEKYTDRLRDAFAVGDDRLASLKEFYGTLNGEKVFGLGKKSRNGTPYETSADSSHLWHIHLSFFRADVENWDRLKGIYEVLLGKAPEKPSKPSVPATPKPTTPQNSQDWTVKLIMALPTIKSGAEGADAKRAQALLVANGRKLSIDGKFGPVSVRDTKAFQKAKGLVADGFIGPKTWAKLLGE